MALNSIDKGASYELYQGEACALRMDWTTGAVRCTYTGLVESAAGALVVQRAEAILRKNKSVSLLHDFWEVTGLESGFRVDVLEWSKQHQDALTSIHAVARSKIVTMTLITWNQGALQGRVNIYSKRQEFDILCKKLGLPINVSMPQWASGASGAAAAGAGI